MPHNLLIRDVRPTGGPATDVLVRAGRIVQLGAGLEAPGTRVLDGGGRLMLPGLVEAHTHLDKSLIGMGWHPHLAGPRIIDKIESERKLKRARGIDPERQARRQVLQSVAFGTTHIRSHVDVDTEHGLAGIEGVAAARAASSWSLSRSQGC